MRLERADDRVQRDLAPAALLGPPGGLLVHREAQARRAAAQERGALAGAHGLPERALGFHLGPGPVDRVVVLHVTSIATIAAPIGTGCTEPRVWVSAGSDGGEERGVLLGADAQSELQGRWV